MSAWMSIPEVFIPEPSTDQKDSKIDPLYQSVFQSFLHPTDIVRDTLLLPRVRDMECEEFAAIPIRALLKAYSADKHPTVLIDCRSSACIGSPAPSYKLCVNAGLTSIIPFSLNGQAGSEVAHALLFLRHIREIKNNGAVLSAAQKVVPPDSRVKENGFPLADASSSVFISQFKWEITKCFKMLDVMIVQSSNDWDFVLRLILNQFEKRAIFKQEAIQWSITHRFSDSFIDATKYILPNCSDLIRDVYTEFDFGCADVLVSLQRICYGKFFPEGIGICWFAGRFGSVGAILLESYDGGKKC